MVDRAILFIYNTIYTFLLSDNKKTCINDIKRLSLHHINNHNLKNKKNESVNRTRKN
jgi:hypothetical protein